MTGPGLPCVRFPLPSVYCVLGWCTVCYGCVLYVRAVYYVVVRCTVCYGSVLCVLGQCTVC